MASWFESARQVVRKIRPPCKIGVECPPSSGTCHDKACGVSRLSGNEAPRGAIPESQRKYFRSVARAERDKANVARIQMNSLDTNFEGHEPNQQGLRFLEFGRDAFHRVPIFPIEFGTRWNASLPDSDRRCMRKGRSSGGFMTEMSITLICLRKDVMV